MKNELTYEPTTQSLSQLIRLIATIEVGAATKASELLVAAEDPNEGSNVIKDQ
jgi:hypothetical protein